MMRQTFIREMQRLQDELLALGSAVQHALAEAVKALQTRDFEASRRLIAADWQINVRYHDIEQGCMQLIATQQPAAGDLRFLGSLIAVAAELERIGDYAKGIAKINLLIGHAALLKPLVDIPHMAAKVQGMLHRSLVAFSRRDLALARAIPAEDDEVDRLYDQIYRELFTYMLQDPHAIGQGNYLLWAGHNLERAADRVTNICERIVYMITGQIVEFDQPDDGIDLPVTLSAADPLTTNPPPAVVS